MTTRYSILLIEDKLGITPGYRSVWESMCLQAGLLNTRITRVNLHNIFYDKGLQLLRKRGNLVYPVFNDSPEVRGALAQWFRQHFAGTGNQYDLIICQDAAALGLLTDDWRDATIDKLRGGVYSLRGIPCLVTLPISAINKHVLKKDVMALNQAEDRDTWDALRESEAAAGDVDEDSEKLFIPPYTIPSGRWILQRDLEKASRLLKAGRGASELSPNITICDSIAHIDYAKDFLSRCKLIANDVETWPEIQLMSVNGYAGILPSGTIEAFVFPFTKERSPFSDPPDTFTYAYQAMREINLLGIPFTYHNAGYDLFWLTRYRMPVRNYAFDSMTMFWSLYPELPKDLAFISSILLDDYQYWKGAGKSDNQATYLRYNALDNIRTLQNTIKLAAMLNQNPRANRNCTDAMRRVISCLQMSMWGLAVDESALVIMGEELEIEAATQLKRLRYLVADTEFNYRSPKQMKHLLYTIFGAAPRNAKGRRIRNTNAASTGAIVQRYVAEEGPLQKAIMNSVKAAMSPAKQISNVIGMKRKWGRVYTGYNAIGTTTSRLSSSESPLKIGSNLQNIRKKYRHWMVPDCNPQDLFLEVDFSASDDVFVTFESADPEKIKVFRSGADAHATNVALLFPNWSYEAVVAGKKAGDPRVVDPVRGIRQGIKKVAHGCNYLMAETTLLQSVGVDSIKAAALEYGYADAMSWTFEKQRAFCGELEQIYRGHYRRLSQPGTKGSWYNDLTEEAVKTGGFTTPFLYFQRFLTDPHSHDVLRALAATAGQAGTAGRINMAMDEFVHGYIMPEFRDALNPNAMAKPLRIGHRINGVRLVLQTHDSFTFHINRGDSRWQQGIRDVITVMTRPVVIRNKLTQDLETFSIGIEVEGGHSWGKGLQKLSHESADFLGDLVNL